MLLSVFSNQFCPAAITTEQMTFQSTAFKRSFPFSKTISEIVETSNIFKKISGGY